MSSPFRNFSCAVFRQGRKSVFFTKNAVFSTVFSSCGNNNEISRRKSSILDIYKSPPACYNNKASVCQYGASACARRIAYPAEYQAYDTNTRERPFPPCIFVSQHNVCRDAPAPDGCFLYLFERFFKKHWNSTKSCAIML